MSLQKFKDELDAMCGFPTKKEAHEQNVCKRCKQTPTFYTELGRKEYGISGFCEPCFDIVCVSEEDKCAVCECPEVFHKQGYIGKTHKFTQKPETDDMEWE